MNDRDLMIIGCMIGLPTGLLSFLVGLAVSGGLCR